MKRQFLILIVLVGIVYSSTDYSSQQRHCDNPGFKGLYGMLGQRGRQGLNGIRGYTGPIGDCGSKGKPGPQGPRGFDLSKLCCGCGHDYLQYPICPVNCQCGSNFVILQDNIYNQYNQVTFYIKNMYHYGFELDVKDIIRIDHEFFQITYINGDHITAFRLYSYGFQNHYKKAHVIQQKYQIVAIKQNTQVNQQYSIQPYDTYFIVDDVDGFYVGQYIKINDEVMLIIDIDSYNKKLTVIRASLGTYAQTHYDNDYVYIVYVWFEDYSLQCLQCACCTSCDNHHYHEYCPNDCNCGTLLAKDLDDVIYDQDVASYDYVYVKDIKKISPLYQLDDIIKIQNEFMLVVKVYENYIKVYRNVYPKPEYIYPGSYEFYSHPSAHYKGEKVLNTDYKTLDKFGEQGSIGLTSNSVDAYQTHIQIDQYAFNILKKGNIIRIGDSYELILVLRKYLTGSDYFIEVLRGVLKTDPEQIYSGSYIFVPIIQITQEYPLCELNKCFAYQPQAIP